MPDNTTTTEIDLSDLFKPVPEFKVPDLATNPELQRISAEYKASLDKILGDQPSFRFYATRFVVRAAVYYGVALAARAAVRYVAKKAGK